MPRRARHHSWLLFPPIAMGILLFMLLVGQRQPPAQVETGEIARPVRTIEVPTVAVVPRASGFGEVQPGRVWEAIAEISGRIIERHPNLERGRVLPAGTVVMRLDPTDYQLNLAQINAQIAAAEAQQQETQQQEKNTRLSLTIEREALSLAETELARLERLNKAGNVTASERDAELRNVLSQRQRVQDLANQLTLYPVQIKLRQAEIERLKAQRMATERDLERTEIRLPINGRISQAPVEKDQFVRQGDVLAIADGLATAEIEAQIPIASLRALLQSHNHQPMDMQALQQRGDFLALLQAQVVLQIPDSTPLTWPARVTRITDVIDPQSRTVGVVVTVENPYDNVIPGQRPPLVKGLFVRIELAGPPLPPAPILPRAALWDNRVYVVDDQSKLAIRPVTPRFSQPGFVVIDQGLKPGEQLVISDLLPAIEGMALAPLLDRQAQQRLIDLATRPPAAVRQP